MATPFRVNVLGSERIVIRLAGSIFGSAGVGHIRVPQDLPIEFDLVGVTGINSMGIRMFREWMTTFSNASIEFSYCPKFFIDQINMVTDLIPVHAKILSLYVPYYSEPTGEEQFVLLTRGKEFDVVDGEVRVEWPALEDSKGNSMEVDVTPERFLACLKRH